MSATMPRAARAIVLLCALTLWTAPGATQTPEATQRPSYGDSVGRNRQVRAEFMRANPCPVTGRQRGPCPGFEVDHIIALCRGGADRAWNLQWLTVEAHRLKTRDDVRACRRMR